MNNNLIIGIDATNLRNGGGRTHLVELLRASNPETHGIARVIVWGSQSTLMLLDNRPWLEKLNPSLQEKGFLARTFWQRFYLAKAVRKAGCNILFVPGGSYFGNFHPVVTMSRNMLPFEWCELLRYGWSWTTIKLILLRLIQSRTFRLADGVVFLTQYAKSTVEQITGVLPHTKIIPHGVNDRFIMQPVVQKRIETYCAKQPYRILYISIINQYKHQWHVVEAVLALRQKGWPLTLDLVGPSYPPALRRLNVAISHFDPEREWVRYHGAVAYSELHDLYAQADLGLFASSCENMPNILLETMATGLPVACSNRGPMPELLRDAGVYFDPEWPDDIARALRELIVSPALRAEKAEASYSTALSFGWERCADDTFGFLARAAAGYRKRSDRCAE